MNDHHEAKVLTWRDVQGARIAIVCVKPNTFRIYRGDIERGEPSPDRMLIAMSAPLPETEARAEFDAVVLHFEQKAKLHRYALAAGAYTPWGRADDATEYGDGVVSYGTASHGGFKLDRRRNALMPAAYRVAGGWYEEDAEWAKVAAVFPDLFTDWERHAADKTLRNWFPTEYEAFTGRILAPGESLKKDEIAFNEANKDNLVVISAIMDDDHPGMVRTIATTGGKRGDGVAEEIFLVEKSEYAARGRYGFVIDRERHQPYPEQSGPRMGGPA